jgi:hypothetical protein
MQCTYLGPSAAVVRLAAAVVALSAVLASAQESSSLTKAKNCEKVSLPRPAVSVFC